MRVHPFLAGLLLLACSRNSTPIDSTQPPGAPPANAPHAAMPSPTTAAPANPHGATVPASPHGGAVPAAAPGAAPAVPAATGPASAGGLAWTATAPLQARAPKSSMRAAEYGIDGDAQSELTVFYFGEGQGGAVDANITRWLGQMTQPNGSDTAAQAKRDESKVNGIPVVTVEAHGTFTGGMGMAAAASSGPIPNAIMLGAIASGPKGPVFFKLVGPAEAVERARAAFEKLVASLHAE